MKKIKIGIIGCGTIGTELAKFVQTECSDKAELSYLCDHHSEKAAKVKKVLKSPAKVAELNELISQSDLIVEAASAGVVSNVVRKAMYFHKRILVMSAGGLLEIRDWAQLLQRYFGKIVIPSGAIAGLDALKAARQGKIREVKLVTRKPPKGLEEAPFFQTHPFPKLTEKSEVCVFKGPAEKAVKSFPQNINVAAVLSLYGIGPSKTNVEIWTPKTYRFNQHEVTIEGDFGNIRTITQNLPSPHNPKTSALAIHSAIASLEKIFSPIKIGT